MHKHVRGGLSWVRHRVLRQSTEHDRTECSMRNDLVKCFWMEEMLHC